MRIKRRDEDGLTRGMACWVLHGYTKESERRGGRGGGPSTQLGRKKKDLEWVGRLTSESASEPQVKRI